MSSIKWFRKFYSLYFGEEEIYEKTGLQISEIIHTFLLKSIHLIFFQVVREDKKKVISFASELKKLTSRSRSMTTGIGVDGPAQSKDDRAACCVALTELQE